MANDLSNPEQANQVSGDGFFEHGAGSDSLFGAVQLAQANEAAAPAAPGQTIHVAPPQGADGPVVIRVEVTPGSIVELPQPFEADAALLAKEGDGNLAIRVGDVTVVLQGYIEANGEAPVTIEGADNQPIDIATVLASTDPAIDIQTAAGPDAGQNGQGADNSGAILAHLEDGNGLGGLESVGTQDQTELGYRTIDNSIRNDFADALVTTNVFGFSVGAISGSFNEGFLRDPAQTDPFTDDQGTYFGTFLHEYRDAVEHPGEAMYAGWADFHGTAVTSGDFDEYLSQTSMTTTVDVHFTKGTGDLVLTGLGSEVKSNGSDLRPEFKDDGHTMFLRREDDNALVAVVHVDGPDASGHFVIETILINRIDHDGIGTGDAGKDSMDVDIQFKVYDGPAPSQEHHEQDFPLEGGETNDGPKTPTSPSIDGSFTATFGDDVPILEKVTYHNQHDGAVAARESEGGGGNLGLIDEDWIRSGAHDKGADGNNAGEDGDTGGGACVTGCIDVNFGGDGPSRSDGKTEEAGKHAFALDTGYKAGDEFGTLHSGGVQLIVLSVDGDHLTVGIADKPFPQQALAEGEEGDTSGGQPGEPTDPIPGCAIFTLTLDQDTGAFKFELKGPLDHGDSIFGDDTGVSALVAGEPEETIALEFGVKAYDDDGDWVDAQINIDVNDDMPVARNDSDTVAAGSHDDISGNVMTGYGTDAPKSGKDSEGGDHAHVVAISAGETTGEVGKPIHGEHGTLTLNADGGYTYTRDPYSPGGVDDVFAYTLKDGDGDTSTATLTVHIENATVSIGLPTCPADTTVHESGLPARDAEAAGSNAAADSEHTEGTITVMAKDGIKSLEIGGDTLTLADLKDLGTNHHEITDAKGTLTLTGFDEGTGALSYTYDLKDNTDANTTTSATFDIKVTDVDDDEGTAQLVINIVDDEPTAVCDEIKLDAPKAPTADVQFVLDISGSMRDQYVNIPGNTYPDNRIGLERYAVEQMLKAHPEIQNVQIVLFDDRSSRSEWMTRDEAISWVKDGDNFDGQGGDTNYDKALDEAMKGIVDDRPQPNSDQTLVYFFSDGNPNEPRNGAGIDGNDSNGNVSESHWTGFVDTHDISNVFAVSLGSSNHLGPIAYPNGSGGAEPNLITLSGPSSANLDDLLGTLTDTIVPVVTPIHGDLTANDVSGADGFGDAKVVSVTYDGNTFDFNSNAGSLDLGLGEGRGRIVINGDGTYTYTPPAKNADGTPFEIEYTIQDGDGDTSTAKLKIDINTRPETDLNGGGQGAGNDAAFVEDFGAVKISPNGTVGDDAGQVTSMTVTLTNHPDNASEKLSLDTDAQNAADSHGLTVTAYNPSTGVLTISGPAAQASVYQTILQGIVYDNSSDTPNTSARHVTVVVSDGTFNSVSHTIDISVTPTNDAPVAEIVPLAFSATEGETIHLSGKIGSTFNMLVGDPDSGNDDVYATLSVTEGKLSVYPGFTGVSVVSGNNSESVVIKGSVSQINDLLKENGGILGGSITYKNDNKAPSSEVLLTLSVNDDGQNGQGGAKSDSDTAIINVADLNERPVTDLNGNGFGSDNRASFKEDYGPIQIAPSGTVKDDGMISSMTVKLTHHPDNAAESLSLNAAAQQAAGNAGLTVTAYDTSTGVLVISGPAAAPSVYQTILQGIVYNNTSDNPDTDDREVTVVVADAGGLTSATHTIEIDVDPTNDAPVATIAPESFEAKEDTPLILSGKGLSVTDPDAGSGTMTVTLKVTAGELDIVKGSTGVTVGGNSQNVTLTGTLVQINKLLNGESNGVITYLNDDDTPAGHVTLTLKADDNGHTGGGELYSTDTAIINIENLPEPPTGHEDHVITNAGKSAFNIAEWALLYNDTDPDTAHGNLDLAAGDGALSGYGNKDTAHHTDGTGQAGWVTFTDTNGNDGVFDYKLTDGSQEGTGHVTITQVSGSSINGTSGDDIIVGGSGDDTLNGRGGTDLIFGGAGDDTMIFGSTDRYDGGAGFDRIEVDASGGTTVTYEAGRFLGVEMVDLGDSDRFLGGENKFALNANDLVGVPTTTLGGHQVSLFVVGDHQSTFFSGNKDDVDLTNFKMTAVQTGVTFTDGATETQHTYNIYESNPLSGGGTVKVAIEAGLDVI